MIRRFSKFVFRFLIVRKYSREIINYAANRVSWNVKRRFHGAFGYALKDYRGEWVNSLWRVKFLNRNIVVPLRASHLSSDWVAAVTLLGHDVEEKQSYLNILSSKQKPDVFFDVGGNFGTHSFIFQSQGVATFYFEPNSSCHDYFSTAIALNGFSPRMEHVALGDKEGFAELRYPKEESWLGSIERHAQQRLEEISPLESETVAQRTIDSYLADIGTKSLLIKIDAEGYEVQILKGASRTIAQNRPTIFFECWAESEARESIWQLFSDAAYGIWPHIWTSHPGPPLSKEAFLQAPQHNFWAAAKDTGRQAVPWVAQP